jgi:hypothetical protein
MLGSETGISPNARPSDAPEMPKRRVRSRARTLTKLDRRLPLGRRITVLTRVYVEALGGEAALSPLKAAQGGRGRRA